MLHSHNQQQPNRDRTAGGNDRPDFRAIMITTAQAAPESVSHTSDAVGPEETVSYSNDKNKQDFRNKITPLSSMGKNLPLETASGWKHPRLTRPSIYYPLAACHVRFHKERLNTVLDDLRQTFHRLSLQVASYESSPIAASCWSLDQVEFRVSLWESREDKEVAVLEIQRRSGDAYIFSRYARSIVALVNGSRSGVSSASVRSMTKQQLLAFTIPNYSACALSSTSMHESTFLPCKTEQLVNYYAFSHNGRIHNSSTYENSKNSAEEALGIANHLLCSCDRYDARQLGLESLCMLTDPSKAGLEVSTQVSEAILLAKGDHHQQSLSSYRRSTQAVLLQLAINGSWPGEEDENDESMTIDNGNGSVALDKGHPHAFLALRVLSQALQVMSLVERDPDSTNKTTPASTGAGMMSQFLVQARLLLSGKDLVQELLSMVRNARPHPHRAFWATQALTAIRRCSHTTALLTNSTNYNINNTHNAIVDAATIKEHHMEVAVLEAQQVGATSHAALEVASEQLLEELRAY